MHFEREIFWTSEGGAGCAVHALVTNLSKQQSHSSDFCSRRSLKSGVKRSKGAGTTLL